MNIYRKSFATVCLQILSPNISDDDMVIILSIAQNF
jgi:hypothetical protein